MKKIALLWPESSLGLYSNRSVEELCEGFGHNTGNLAFFYAIRHHIVGEIHSIPWHSPADMVAPYDVVIIPCANQLGPHTHLGHLAILMQRWQVPIVAIGLGAQAPSMNEDVEVSEGTLEWVRTIAAKSSGVSNIWTRGPYTTKQLARLGINNATTGNCPSHFINTAPDLGKRIAAAWGAFSLPRSISLPEAIRRGQGCEPVNSN